MAKKKAKTSYKQACARDIGNGNNSKFTKACVKRFPELTGGAPRKKVKAGPVPAECREILSSEMQKGHRKTAFGKYWDCIRESKAES